MRSLIVGGGLLRKDNMSSIIHQSRLGRFMARIYNTRANDFVAKGGSYHGYAYSITGTEYELVYWSQPDRLVLRHKCVATPFAVAHLYKRVWETDEAWELDYISYYREGLEAENWLYSLNPLEGLAFLGD
jgi:hypothetical protein